MLRNARISLGLFAAPLLCGPFLASTHSLHHSPRLGGHLGRVDVPSLLLETSDLQHTDFPSLIKEDAVEDLKC